MVKRKTASGCPSQTCNMIKGNQYNGYYFETTPDYCLFSLSYCPSYFLLFSYHIDQIRRYVVRIIPFPKHMIRIDHYNLSKSETHST